MMMVLDCEVREKSWLSQGEGLSPIFPYNVQEHKVLCFFFFSLSLFLCLKLKSLSSSLHPIIQKGVSESV